LSKRAYESQIASMPQVVADVLTRPGIPALDASRPIVFSGIGTSLHAARVAADWIAALSGGAVRAAAIDAHDLASGAAPLQPADQVVVISHRGKKVCPTGALMRARELGCRTVAIVGQGAPEQCAEVTIRTCANETAGTFSVSYLASLAALARIVAATLPNFSREFAAALPQLPRCIERTLAHEIAPSWVNRLAAASPLLITGAGTDFVTAQEAALKIKEGAWLWTEAMSSEFAMHGTPASFRPEMGAIVMLPAHDDGGRTKLLLGVLQGIGLRHIAVCSDAVGADMRFEPAPHPLLRPFPLVLPFHQLTLKLSKHLNTDPDTLHGNRQPWAGVMKSLQL
jgi:glucosamine--fructose-6-phosphate aminotransferase (isomerizing)